MIGTRELVVRRLGVVDYRAAWDEQRRLHAAVVAGDAPDTVLLLEHPSVYTAGKRARPGDHPSDGTPVVEVDRGGEVTWHGPGQLVGYPIVRLPGPAGRPRDVVAFVRRLEQLLIAACADLGLTTVRVKGRTGVWVPPDQLPPARLPTHGPPSDGHFTEQGHTHGSLALGQRGEQDPTDRRFTHRVLTEGQGRRGQAVDGRTERKVASIGIRVARGVALHGFALNCDNDLTPFTRIVPCGIPGAQATSLSVALARPVSVADVIPVVERHLPTLLAS